MIKPPPSPRARELVLAVWLLCLLFRGATATTAPSANGGGEVSEHAKEQAQLLYAELGPSAAAPLVVPNTVHQIYDYVAPNFFLYLSLKCVQRFARPTKHVLWVNDEGKFRRAHWAAWQQKAQQSPPGSWDRDLAGMVQSGKIEARFLTFPAHPPGNTSTFASNKAHRSDFVRLRALLEEGGAYLDTDAFVVQSLAPLRQHNFTMSFDNIVNAHAPLRIWTGEGAGAAPTAPTMPARLNNGVMLSAPSAPFAQLWEARYSAFNPLSFDHDSSVVPYRLMQQYPDLLHLEMSRIAPMSFAFGTARAAEALACGLLMPGEGIWAPRWTEGREEGAEIEGAGGADKALSRGYTYRGVQLDRSLYRGLRRKIVLHLTMSQVR
ncbi:hypothetical protein B484DRAFT_254934 [Ochromonadaceae sp. CCMP2298]|nr:hypothetical protein B484DRAFT_254934 [Ochromonadaceae sp. CCMP2298]